MAVRETKEIRSNDASADTAALARDLESLVEGDVRFDLFSRTLYSTDASIYRVPPIGVVMPKSAADVEKVCAYAYARGIPILPRGAGTSLAGQAVGRAIVLDFTRYMNRILAIDPDARTATVEPGVVLADLNRQLAPHGLKFAPDPAAGDRSAIGGAIGNNSSGSHSLVYGMTESYVDTLDMVLDDGTRVTFSELTDAELTEKVRLATREGQIYTRVVDVLTRYDQEITRAYPRLKRNATGYNLPRIVRNGTFNLSRLISGSEGTLGVIVGATVRLEPLPKATSLVLLSYTSLVDAMRDTKDIVETGAAAVEVMDDVMFDLARKTLEFADVVERLPEGTSSALIVEYYADTPEDAERLADALADRFTTGGGGRALAATRAEGPQEKRKLWALRTAGLPILLSSTAHEKHIPFVEDAAIPPEQLPEYVEDFQKLLREHGTYASFYAHAGPGVLHVRPLINTKGTGDVTRMFAIAEAATRLVMRYGGVPSGEHGDGRSRTQWSRIVYGEAIWQAFHEIKEAFDPTWILNPGNVVFRDDAPVDMRENLRFEGSDRASGPAFPIRPTLRWANEHGLEGMVDLCHGCAGCRTSDGGVMCPTYRASHEEITTTRGRANLLREAISGTLPQETLDSEAFQKEVLDLCIGCKGCKRDCPSQVDMAKLKLELKHHYYQKHGVPLRERLFSNTASLYRLGSALAPLSNWVGKLPGSGALAERLLGISRHRPLPQFHRRTFAAWFKGRRTHIDPAACFAKVKLLVDCHTNHNHPEIGRAGVALLEAAGVYVEMGPMSCCGRPAMSKGLVDLARTQARGVSDWIVPAVESGWDIVGFEPSCVSALQDEYADLLDPAPTAATRRSFEIMEYLDLLRRDGRFNLDFDAGTRLAYHGHCHQKALKREAHAPEVLRAAGFDVHVVDSGCCGMAGSFGYEAEHYEMSKSIGRILFDKIERTDHDMIVAPGASCSTQIAQGMHVPVYHPAVLLAERLRR